MIHHTLSNSNTPSSAWTEARTNEEDARNTRMSKFFCSSKLPVVATPYLLDQDWVVAIEEALATPATVPFAIEPEALAVYDVMHGVQMRPEQFYRTAQDCYIYIFTYKDAVAAWAAQVDEVNAQPRNGLLQKMIDYGAELQELQDGMADELFNRWGGA